MPDPIDALPTPPSRNDAPATFIARANALLAALVNFVTQTNAVAVAMNLNATTGTSATSNSIGTGAKTFTADTGKSWQPGMFIVIADTAAPSTNSMLAQITSYNSGTGALVVDVKAILGSGTKTAWTISQTANPVPLDDSVKASSLADSALGFSMINGTLTASVGSSALTVAIKTKAGADPSSTDPVLVLFRNATLGTGDYTVLSLTAATSVVVSSGSTLGTVSGQANRIYVAGVNDGGTFRLGVYNPWDNTNNILFGLQEDALYSSTAEGGAGAADSAQVLYTGTAVSSKPIRILGYVESTQATAGTWATTPSKVQMMAPGVKKTGDIVQSKITPSSAVSTGTTTTPFDDSIPQITEGNEFMTIAVTPNNAANLLKIKAFANCATNTAGVALTSALHQDSTANALKATTSPSATADIPQAIAIEHHMVAGTTSSTTFRNRVGRSNAGTVTFNGSAGARIYGGVMSSFMSVEEVFI